MKCSGNMCSRLAAGCAGSGSPHAGGHPARRARRGGRCGLALSHLAGSPWRALLDATRTVEMRLARDGRAHKRRQALATIVIDAAAARHERNARERLAAIVVGTAATRERYERRTRFAAIVVRQAARVGADAGRQAERPEAVPSGIGGVQRGGSKGCQTTKRQGSKLHRYHPRSGFSAR